MALLLVGFVLIALGLFAGSVLLLAPLGLTPWAIGTALWVLFPVLSVLGYALFVIGARNSSIRWMSAGLSYLLLLLALAAAVVLVLAAASVLSPVGGTLPLWYVLGVAGLLSAVGIGSRLGSGAATSG